MVMIHAQYSRDSQLPLLLKIAQLCTDAAAGGAWPSQTSADTFGSKLLA